LARDSNKKSSGMKLRMGKRVAGERYPPKKETRKREVPTRSKDQAGRTVKPSKAQPKKGGKKKKHIKTKKKAKFSKRGGGGVNPR